jgi:hypothetical protein
MPLHKHSTTSQKAWPAEQPAFAFYPPIKSKSKDKMRKCDFSHKKVLEIYWMPAYNWSVLYE